MTKSERRDLLKAVYVKACTGDLRSVFKLRQLMHPKKVYAKCLSCSVLVRTKFPKTARCQTHQTRRLSMRKMLTLLMLVPTVLVCGCRSAVPAATPTSAPLALPSLAAYGTGVTNIVWVTNHVYMTIPYTNGIIAVGNPKLVPLPPQPMPTIPPPPDR